MVDQQSSQPGDQDRHDHQYHIDRLAPRIKHKADQKQHKIAKTSWHCVIKNQYQREEPEQEQQAAEYHTLFTPENLVRMTIRPHPQTGPPARMRLITVISPKLNYIDNQPGYYIIIKYCVQL